MQRRRGERGGQMRRWRVRYCSCEKSLFWFVGKSRGMVFSSSYTIALGGEITKASFRLLQLDWVATSKWLCDLDGVRFIQCWKLELLSCFLGATKPAIGLFFIFTTQKKMFFFLFHEGTLDYETPSSGWKSEG